MPDFPLGPGGAGFTQVVSTASTVTSGAANTKGSFTELVASTAFDADGVIFLGNRPSGTGTGLYDLAVGAAASETVIISNLLNGGISRHAEYIHVPISIPAGSRISARSQDTTGAVAHQCRCMLTRGNLWQTPPAGRLVTLGAVTGTSRGTTIDPGASLGTYGSWATLSASTDGDIAAILLKIGGGGNAAPSDSAAAFFVDVGVGAAASEVALVDGFPFPSSTVGNYGPLPPIWLPAGIPAGSRISARAKSNITDATDRLFDLVVYGLVI